MVGVHLGNFFVADAELRGGVHLVFKDVDADGRADLVAGSGEGEAARVRVYRSASLLASAAQTPDGQIDPFGGVPLPGGLHLG